MVKKITADSLMARILSTFPMDDEHCPKGIILFMPKRLAGETDEEYVKRFVIITDVPAPGGSEIVPKQDEAPAAGGQVDGATATDNPI